MNLIVGVVLLAIGIGMIVLGRRITTRPFMNSPLVFAVYPAATLVFLAMGILTIVMNL